MVLKKASDQGNVSVKNHMSTERSYFVKERSFLLRQEETCRLLLSSKGDCSCVFGFWISHRMFAL